MSLSSSRRSRLIARHHQARLLNHCRVLQPPVAASPLRLTNAPGLRGHDLSGHELCRALPLNVDLKHDSVQDSGTCRLRIRAAQAGRCGMRKTCRSHRSPAGRAEPHLPEACRLLRRHGTIEASFRPMASGWRSGSFPSGFMEAPTVVSPKSACRKLTRRRDRRDSRHGPGFMR